MFSHTVKEIQQNSSCSFFRPCVRQLSSKSYSTPCLCSCFLPEMCLFPPCDLALAADRKDGTGSSGRKIFVTIPLGNLLRKHTNVDKEHNSQPCRSVALCLNISILCVFESLFKTRYHIKLHANQVSITIICNIQ